MKASEANKITEGNKPTLEHLLKSVEVQAQQGVNQLIIPDMADKTKLEFLNLGYEIRQHLDPMGIKHTIISW